MPYDFSQCKPYNHILLNVFRAGKNALIFEQNSAKDDRQNSLLLCEDVESNREPTTSSGLLINLFQFYAENELNQLLPLIILHI